MSSIVSASFLIAVWCISDTFFGLPLASGSSGFLPGMLINLVVLLLTLPSALLYTEAILSLVDGANIISLCKKLIGPITAVLVAILFIFLHYSWLSYFFHDLIPVVSEFLHPLFSSYSSIISGVLLVVLLIAVVFLGVGTTSRINYCFFIGLVLSTLWVVALLIHKVSTNYLLRNEWAFAFLAIPTYVGFYYYHSILPTLSTYLDRNHIKIKKAIFLGSGIILVFHAIWQFLIIGVIPESILWKATGSLRSAQQGTILFEGSTLLTYLYQFLLFFSITSSLLIEGCILVDVFGDGLKIPLEKRVGLKRFLLCLVIFVPSALLSPFDWVLATDTISGWGELILVGPVPALLVWQLRYTHKLEAPQLLPGGRPMLIVFALLSILLFYVEGASLLWSSKI